jgi:hypothetical protein
MGTDIKQMIVEHYCDLIDDAPLFADGFDDAIIGIDPNTMRVVYSRNECINVLMRMNGMGEEEALEFLEYNTFCAYVGEYTPIFIEDFNWTQNA